MKPSACNLQHWVPVRVVERRCAVAEFDHAVAAAVDWPPWAGNLVVELWPIPGGKFLAIGTFVPQRGDIVKNNLKNYVPNLFRSSFLKLTVTGKEDQNCFFAPRPHRFQLQPFQQLELIRHLDLQQP